MGKSDQQKTQANITDKVNQDNANTNTGISDTQSRMAALTPVAAQQKNDIWSGYSNLANNPGAGGAIDQAASNRLLSGNYSDVKGGGSSSGGGGGGGSSSGGGGGIGSPASSAGDYLGVFNELAGKNAGFDPTRLSNINQASDQLRDTSGNYGDVNANIGKLSNAENNYGATNTSISGLQNFAKTGGLNSGQLSNINRDSLTNIEKTGGYSAGDIANERARGNAGIASTYSNMQDALTKQKMASGQMGPGWSQAGFKLARQGAQDVAGQTQKTEADIHDQVVKNQLAAGSKLGDLGLGTAQLQSQNTLSGYNDAGQLDVAKNTAIQDAWDKAGKLGLGRQAQIDAATKAAADIDNQTQSTMNQTRLGAASGLSQDTLGRMSIGASSGAAQAALDAANQRFLISEGDSNRNTGLQGMLNTYGATPNELQFNQTLNRGYTQDASKNSNDAINARIGASRIPGIGSTIGSGLDVAGKAFSMIGGGIPGLSSFFGGGGNSDTTDPSKNPYLSNYITGGGGTPDKGAPGAVR